MRFSFKIGRIFGIDIRVHFLFVLLFLWFGLENSNSGLVQLLIPLTLFTGVFFFVLLHELGHCYVALKKGIRVLDITLWPLGGLARLARMPDDPATEFRIAIAGPLVNLGVAAIIFLGLVATRSVTNIVELDPIGGGLLEAFLYVNVVMALFNLIPAFPMDGGRILRSLLARKWGAFVATRAAVRVSRTLAVLALAAAIWPPAFVREPILLGFMAVFIWMSGTRELVASQLRELGRRMGATTRDDAGVHAPDWSPEAPEGFDNRFPTITREHREALEGTIERLRRNRDVPPNHVS